MILEELHNIMWRVIAVCDDDENSVLDELCEALSGDLEQDGEKLAADLKKLSTHGPRIFNDDKCHQICKKEQIYQLTSKRLRMLWFYDKNMVIVCAHGFVKYTQKTPKHIKERAVEVKKQYFNDKENGCLRMKQERET